MRAVVYKEPFKVAVENDEAVTNLLQTIHASTDGARPYQDLYISMQETRRSSPEDSGDRSHGSGSSPGSPFFVSISPSSAIVPP